MRANYKSIGILSIIIMLLSVLLSPAASVEVNENNTRAGNNNASSRQDDYIIYDIQPWDNLSVKPTTIYGMGIQFPYYYDILNVKLTLKVKPTPVNLSLSPAWDFSIVSPPTNTHYPDALNYSTHPYLYTGLNGTHYYRCFMGYQLPANFSSWKITNGTLNITNDVGPNATQAQTRVGDHIYNIYAVRNTTESEGSTWFTQPNRLFSNPLGSFELPPQPNGNNTIDFNISALEDWFNKADETLWMMVRSANETTSTVPSLSIFHSAEHPQQDTTPNLTISYIPYIEDLQFGWWLLDPEIHDPDPSKIWYTIVDMDEMIMTLDFNTFDEYLQNTIPDISGNMNVEFRFTTNKEVTFEQIELNTTLMKIDSDGDGAVDSVDKFPSDPTQWMDSDLDGFGDNKTGTNGDQFPYDSTQWVDFDSDGYGDNPDGNDPDIDPLDNDRNNPIKNTYDYIEYIKDDYYFSIEIPDVWTSTSTDDGKGAVDGVYYDYLAVFREQTSYTANARIDVKAVEDIDASNTDDYIMNLLQEIINYVNQRYNYSMYDSPTYGTDESDRRYGDVVLRYSENGEMVITKWRVIVSEYNEMYYVLSASVKEGRFNEYLYYFNYIFDKFEIQDEDDPVFMIICALIIVVVIITIIVGLAFKKQQETRTGTTKPDGITVHMPPPPSTPGRTAPPRRTQPIRPAQASYKTPTLYCRVCDGLGRCNECDGMGTIKSGFFGQNIINCPNCKGMGMCPSCKRIYYHSAK
ncbi:MAG: hypothetical protein JSV49_04515 [Thermoplasmata archaeon]|nr:MAG: hypothetical protein JSV49_04515 [Thermoplasmata archaeon]